jgi:quercetin dioxygenase-like cupin family protein
MLHQKGGKDVPPIDRFGFRLSRREYRHCRRYENANHSGDLKWGPAPPTLPKGAEIAVLSGDPSKDGPFVIRLKMPSGYKFPAHNHPTDEFVTVISGNFHVGMGDKLDEKKAIELAAGGYVEAPAKINHYGWVSSPSVVQVQAQGPFGITYVNPADDPSKQ